MFAHADVVELVDSLDLGSNARACRFESCHPHHNRRKQYRLRRFFCCILEKQWYNEFNQTFLVFRR